ncbi:hypothetical protein Glove_180g52 [Diversispora epigaea]|uniref:Treble clef zinc finger domain-containing protein n=1 Tax=Diversispora epigaea TaxID=1348612 RepID=A0A397IRJ6_9GLOM|nr:hypothetical protein Glove_180g52 [Diversispora epigaea]
MTKKFSLSDALKIVESRGGKLAKELAYTRNGKCISENYINSNSRLLWECENGHQFRTSLALVKNRGCWCPECRKLGLEFAQDLAYKKGGICLSNSYRNKLSPLLWSYSKGHSWYALIGNIKRGTWCPHCCNESKRLGIEHVKELARSKNGECLSNIYINYKTYLLWRCDKKHIWYSTLGSRKFVSKYLGLPSKIRRSDFLKTLESPAGLELDIYYPQGDPNNFSKQQERDQLKKKLCEDNSDMLGITKTHM